MPIEGRFYTSAELQKLLGVKKQRISNLAREQNWYSPIPGLYASGPADDGSTVDAYLHARARMMIKGQCKLDWDDTYDIDCPIEECDGICLRWPDDKHYKCAYGHMGQSNDN